MPFFENARQFEINGGNFIDVKGNQNNYHYDQSVKVSGQGNSAVYSHGSYHRGGDKHTSNHAGHMTVMGQGDNARVNLGANSIPANYSPPQPNYASRHDQLYAHLQANTQPQPLPYGYGSPVPSNGMFYNSTGHVNQPNPQQQSQYYQNGAPPPPQPAYQHPTPTPSHYPAHHSQPSIHSAPANVNVPLIQVNQSTHQRNPSQTSGTLSPNMMPQPSSQQSALPQVDNQTAALGVMVAQPSPSVSGSAGSMISGTTLAQSPQPMPTTPPPVFPSPTPTAVPAATTAISPSASSTSSPAAPGQVGTNIVPGLDDFPGLILQPGATLENVTQEEGGKKKKKKKNKFFSRLFGKAPKQTALAANV